MTGPNRRYNLSACLIMLVFAAFLTSAKGDDMEDQTKKYTEQECQKLFAVKLNNLTWEMLGKQNRTNDENRTMVNTAHASLYHWSVIGGPLNLQRGEWLVSHVYAVLGRSEPALYHARQCLALTEEHKFVDFDLGYAYEAMARAQAAAGNVEEAAKYKSLATDAGKNIKQEEDRKLFLGDLAAEPWYGVK